MIIFCENVKFKWLLIKFISFAVGIINRIDKVLQYFGITLFPLTKASIFKSLDDELLQEAKVFLHKLSIGNDQCKP